MFVTSQKHPLSRFLSHVLLLLAILFFLFFLSQSSFPSVLVSLFDKLHMAVVKWIHCYVYVKAFIYGLIISCIVVAVCIHVTAPFRCTKDILLLHSICGHRYEQTCRGDLYRQKVLPASNLDNEHNTAF